MTDHDPFDPRLGSAIDKYRPTRALDARVKELAAQYVGRDRQAIHTLLDVAADALEAEEVPQVMVSLLETLAVHVTGAVGEKLAVTRLAGDVKCTRDEIIEYGETGE